MNIIISYIFTKTKENITNMYIVHRHLFECNVIPANTKHLYNICTMLDQRRRRWADVVQMLYKCFVFAGLNKVWIKHILPLTTNSGSDSHNNDEIAEIQLLFGMVYWRICALGANTGQICSSTEKLSYNQFKIFALGQVLVDVRRARDISINISPCLINIFHENACKPNL